MEIPEELKERIKYVGGTPIDEGNGYISLVGHGGHSAVAYVLLPIGHPDIGKDYNDLYPDVNGGLTWGFERLYGWDYAHYKNYGTPEGDIKKALKYFRSREKK